MNMAAALAERMNHLGVADGMEIALKSTDSALHFDILDEAMCIMHSDGSVNIIDNVGKGVMTLETISPENILRVLKHYRPFREVFKQKMQ